MIAQERKRALMREVTALASEILERTADTTILAWLKEEDTFARKYLRGIAGSVRKSQTRSSK